MPNFTFNSSSKLLMPVCAAICGIIIWSIMAESKFIPPKKLLPSWSITFNSPAVARTSATSKVPPPKSYTSQLPPFSIDCTSVVVLKKARLAAIGSWSKKTSLKPAACPALMVALLCILSNDAGMVITQASGSSSSCIKFLSSLST